MPRRSKSASPFASREDPEMNISPLIDVAFLLLIYFIVTTTLQKSEADLEMALPGVDKVESDAVQIDQMMIRIDSDGGILVNEEVVDPPGSNFTAPGVSDRLERFALSCRLAQSEALVIVNCHPDAIQQRFVDVLNACAKAAITNISIMPN